MSPSPPVGAHPWPKAPTVWRDGRTVRVSVPFTWNLPAVREFCMQASFEHDQVIIGGPAAYLLPEFLTDLPKVTIQPTDPTALQHVYPNATRTTIGCPNRCPFCAVPKVNGEYQELEDWPDRPILIDDNLLAASQAHFDKVMDRLEKYREQKIRVEFNQGLDARLLTAYHAGRFARLWKPVLRLACDSRAMMPAWQEAYRRLRRAGVYKYSIRTFALIGYRTGPEEAWDRCQWIEHHGVKVQPAWYHPLDAMHAYHVTPQQEAWGWDNYERRRILEWFYRRRKVRRTAGERS